ncbi:hypothetical protein CP556_24740 [Natrinema sp. CBA1119]|uniref:hypothetical protein n=1 Tax=Natrinema sp. CBA1119 TaxID=1608465 RepID=UPI000BF5DDA2|nr:hypothetical protein [Natrinema sp. CBA1119]PGF14219.1 hypothetical protein CP556_24740 [Natrinema sp. CBA1119]
MNRRERKARHEPDDPVESKIVSVDRVDPADAGDAFHSHGGHRAEITDHRYVSKLEGAFESEEWVAFRATYRTYIPRIWRWDHDLPQGGSESTQHISLKVLAAEFLDRCGHAFSRLDNLFYDGTSEYNREWVYDPPRFEVGYDAGIADVACDCDDCNTYVEVGRIAAKKWYTASQY